MKSKVAAITVIFMLISSTSIFAQETISKDGVSKSITPNISDAVSISTQAKEVSPEKLTEILSEIKRKIVIYDKDATFKYSVNFEYGINMYNLSWDNENYNTYIKYGEDKNIYWYYSYSKDENKTEVNTKIKNLPVYDKKQASAIAEDFIQKSLPEEFKNFKLKASTGSLNASIYNFEFDYYKNKISVDGINATVLVDAVTGKIVSFSTSLNQSINYEDSVGVISFEQAKAAYKNQLGMKVIYQSEYDFKNDKIDKVKLIYIPNYSREYAIDAKNGKRINLYKEMYSSNFGEGGPESEAKAIDESGVKPQLTDQEMSEIQSKADLASLNQAKEKVASYEIEVLKDDMTVNSAQMYESKINTSSGYIWSLNYNGPEDETNANVQVDAKTLELIGFNSYKYKDGENQVTSAQIEKAKAIAEKALNKYSKIGKEKLIIDEINLEEQKNTKSQYVYVKYNRVENGIEFPENYIDVTYDISSEGIISYNQNWYKVKLPENKNIVQPEMIYNQMFKENQLSLKYKVGYPNNSRIRSKLIYDINQDDYSKPLIFDAITGKRIESQQQYGQVPSEYKDINKSKYPKEIQTLLILGIGFEGGELNPQKTIKQDEYLYLIAQTFEYIPVPLYKMENMTSEEKHNIEEQLRARGILLKDEKMLNEEITREEAIKYIIRALGYEKIAINTQIFKLNITDNSKVSDSYVGYVAIGDALNIIIKDDENRFGPKSNITRDEALKMVYNYLK